MGFGGERSDELVEQDWRDCRRSEGACPRVDSEGGTRRGRGCRLGASSIGGLDRRLYESGATVMALSGESRGGGGGALSLALVWGRHVRPRRRDRSLDRGSGDRARAAGREARRAGGQGRPRPRTDDGRSTAAPLATTMLSRAHLAFSLAERPAQTMPFLPSRLSADRCSLGERRTDARSWSSPSSIARSKGWNSRRPAWVVFWAGRRPSPPPGTKRRGREPAEWRARGSRRRPLGITWEGGVDREFLSERSHQPPDEVLSARARRTCRLPTCTLSIAGLQVARAGPA
jgi:hypothetical protein